MKESLIRSVPLFASLPDSEIEHLAATLGLSQLPERAILLREGEADDHFYVLLEGKVEVVKALGSDAERVLGVRQTGALLGDMSLFIQDGRHTASVRALTPLKLLRITHLEFDALLHRQPGLVYELVRIMSQRLEESENLTILDLREKNRQLSQAYEELKAAHLQIIEKEKLERELEIARRIQQSVLPDRPPKAAGFDFGALMTPARAVGGDFYDFIPLHGNRLGVVVGDVSDKGVPAALFMALTYSLLRAEANRARGPLPALRHLNSHLLEMNVTEMFVTILYGELNLATHEFHYARAGHPVPIILDQGGQPIEVSWDPGQPLGLFHDPLLDVQCVNLPPGSTMLIYSDGVDEAADAQGRMFGQEGTEKVLRACLGAPAQSVCERLVEAVLAHSEPHPHQDDITVVCIKCIGK